MTPSDLGSVTAKRRKDGGYLLVEQREWTPACEHDTNPYEKGHA